MNAGSVPLAPVDMVKYRIKKGQYEELISSINDLKDEQAVEDDVWDLISELSKHITHENDQALVDACSAAVRHIVRLCNPKEVLLSLLGQFYDDTPANNDTKLMRLLPVIETTLMRLPARRHQSLDEALVIVNRHVSSIPVPTYDQDGQRSGDFDSTNIRIQGVLNVVLDFLKPFVREVSTRVTLSGPAFRSTKVEHQKMSLAKFMFKILQRPVSCLEVSVCPDDQLMCVNRNQASILMEYTADLFGDFYKLTSHFLSKEGKDDEIHNVSETNQRWDVSDRVPVIGSGCFLYLVLHERFVESSFPSIFATKYLLSYVLKPVTALLRQNHVQVVEKGVSLLTTVLHKVPDHSLDKYVLENLDYKNVFDAMAAVMVKCPKKVVRQATLQCVPLFLGKFDSLGRNLFLLYVIKSSDHSGLLGYTTQLLKNEIDSALKTTPPGVYFTGSWLNRHFDEVFTLPCGIDFDLLANIDRIMASLNLLRYLVIRDRCSDNVTGIWSRLDRLDAGFFKEVRGSMGHTRSHYRLDLKRMQADESGAGKLEFNVSVAGESVPSLTRDDQVRVSEQALDSIDMVESVLARVTELIDLNKVV